MPGIVIVPILAAILAELVTGSTTAVSVTFAAVIALELVVLGQRARR